MNKAIISVIGKDCVGIIGRICTFLADAGVNIEDISQTILQGYFTMMMVVDISGMKMGFDEAAAALSAIGEEIGGLVIKMQHEDIFNTMHRI